MNAPRQSASPSAAGRLMLRVLLRAGAHRRAKLITVIAALAMGATLASAFLSLYYDLPAKMNAEFRTLGPNLLIAPASTAASEQPGGDAPSELMEAAVLETARSAVPGAQMLPWLYAIGRVNGRSLMLSGTEIERLKAVHPSWRIAPVTHTGAGEGEAWLGERALAALGLTVENADQQWITLEYAGAEHHLPLRGITSTGTSTDEQMILPLAKLQEITSRPGRLSAIEVAAPGEAARVERTLGTLSSALGGQGAEVRALRPIIESQARVIMKVRGLMFGLTAVVLALVLLSVLTTISGLVLDRSREIGVMKALGGSNARIVQLLMAETSLLALAAAPAGYLAGFALARAAARHIFPAATEATLLSLRGDVFAAVAGITMAVALVACALSAQQLKRVDPAVILRGE